MASSATAAANTHTDPHSPMQYVSFTTLHFLALITLYDGCTILTVVRGKQSHGRIRIPIQSHLRLLFLYAMHVWV